MSMNCGSDYNGLVIMEKWERNYVVDEIHLTNIVNAKVDLLALALSIMDYLELVVKSMLGCIYQCGINLFIMHVILL